MASSADVRDIMGMTGLGGPETLTKESIIGRDKPKKLTKKTESIKRPEGMARELYNLICTDIKDVPALYPSDGFNLKDKSYKTAKANLGMRLVRPWKWTSFVNPARKDNLVLHHWRRAGEETKEYEFARFNKTVELPVFTDAEYVNHLTVDGWTRAETEHLLDLCGRFDLRFPIIFDRWDSEKFKMPRTVEDLKKRYYGIIEKLDVIRPDPSRVGRRVFHFDIEHERLRKEQLEKLFNRKPEEVEEEEWLRNEVRRINARRKERERKTQDLQRLIRQAGTFTSSRQPHVSAGSTGQSEKKSSKKKIVQPHTSLAGKSPTKDSSTADGSGIKFPDNKNPGTSLRSTRLKLPSSLAPKKAKAVEQCLREVGLEHMTIAHLDIAQDYNDLRSDMVLLYDMKSAITNCEQELQSLKAEYEALNPGKTLEIPEKLRPSSDLSSASRPKAISDVIDVMSLSSTPIARKRKAALEQGNVLKKIKNKQY